MFRVEQPVGETGPLPRNRLEEANVTVVSQERAEITFLQPR